MSSKTDYQINQEMSETMQNGIRRHIHPLDRFEETKILETAPGYVRLSYKVGPGSLNLYGVLHGSVIFYLCDTAAGIATYACGVSNVTQNSSIQFVKSVSEGMVFAEGRAVHRGRHTTIVQVTVTDEGGRLIATASFTMFNTGMV